MRVRSTLELTVPKARSRSRDGVAMNEVPRISHSDQWSGDRSLPIFFSWSQVTLRVAGLTTHSLWKHPGGDLG